MLNPYKQWDKPINWCRKSSIHSSCMIHVDVCLCNSFGLMIHVDPALLIIGFPFDGDFFFSANRSIHTHMTHIVSICATRQSKIWSIIMYQQKMQPPRLNKTMLEMAPFSKAFFSKDPECERVLSGENGTSASSHPHLPMFRDNTCALPTCVCVYVYARARLGLTGWWFRLVVSLSSQ